MRTSSILLICLLALSCTSADAAKPMQWAAVNMPARGQAQSIGTPAAGCLMGAEVLETEGPGWQVLRLERKRNFAHPVMIDYIHWLGKQVHDESLGAMIVGDLSQPRGGPMSFGHGSHQNGLDADILFRLTDQPLTDDERERPDMISVVSGQHVDKSLWSDKLERLVEIAASSPQVERIFVNPAIKAHLCKTLPQSQHAWLRKLRPWWGHDEHFHVRLACPSGSPDCVAQTPPPEGDGCGYEVESWLEKPTLNIPSNKPNTRNVTLPAQCQSVIKTAGQ
jgi:penicillin-insensitive murein endopeptidase